MKGCSCMLPPEADVLLLCRRHQAARQRAQSCSIVFNCAGAQVKDIKGDDVICTALNDAHMDGLLTVIHSEREGDGMSSLQTDLPLLTDYDEQAIKTFIKEFEVSAMTALVTQRSVSAAQATPALTD